MKNPLAKAGFAVVERRVIVEAHHMAARAPQHGVARGRVPLHRAAKARIDIRLSRRHEAEFQRASRAFQVRDPVFRDVVIGRRIAVRFRRDDE
jgi:hypothetical protein